LVPTSTTSDRTSLSRASLPTPVSAIPLDSPLLPPARSATQSSPGTMAIGSCPVPALTPPPAFQTARPVVRILLTSLPLPSLLTPRTFPPPLAPPPTPPYLKKPRSPFPSPHESDWLLASLPRCPPVRYPAPAANRNRPPVS